MSRKNKYIIMNNTDLNDLEAMDLIMRVMRKGRISNNHTQYCYSTMIGEYVINANKTASGSDTFRIYKER